MQPGTPILVVEDEPMIAMMLEAFVEDLGHVVAGTAASVVEALDLVETGGFGFAILDVNLRGGERSTPVAEALASRGVPFIVSSGADERMEGAFAGRPLLLKPYSLAQMSAALG